MPNTLISTAEVEAEIRQDAARYMRLAELERAVIEAAIEWCSNWSYERETALRDSIDALVAARGKR